MNQVKRRNKNAKIYEERQSAPKDVYNARQRKNAAKTITFNLNWICDRDSFLRRIIG